jgi:hypothetical protein
MSGCTDARLPSAHRLRSPHGFAGQLKNIAKLVPSDEMKTSGDAGGLVNTGEENFSVILE